MTHSEGSCTLTYPDLLEENIFWRRRAEICFWAKYDNMSVEDMTGPWAGNTLWSSADKKTRDELRDPAMLQQWRMILPYISERTRYRWAVAYEASL